jgi:hypothetical protein
LADAKVAAAPLRRCVVRVQPRRLKGHTLDITYSRLHEGNGTRCDPVVGPFVASKWAGLGRVSAAGS